MYGETFRERLQASRARADARALARPWWKNVLIGMTPAVVLAAGYAIAHADDSPSSPPTPAAVRSACAYVDRDLVSTLFAMADATLTEEGRQIGLGFTRYICLVNSKTTASLRLELDVYAGRRCTR